MSAAEFERRLNELEEELEELLLYLWWLEEEHSLTHRQHALPIEGEPGYEELQAQREAIRRLRSRSQFTKP